MDVATLEGVEHPLHALGVRVEAVRRSVEDIVRPNSKDPHELRFQGAEGLSRGAIYEPHGQARVRHHHVGRQRIKGCSEGSVEQRGRRHPAHRHRRIGSRVDVGLRFLPVGASERGYGRAEAFPPPRARPGRGLRHLFETVSSGHLSLAQRRPMREGVGSRARDPSAPMVLSRAVLAPFEIAAEALRVPLGDIYREHRHLLDSPPPTLNWSEFAALQRSMAGLAGTEEALKAVGRAIVAEGVISRAARSVGLFISPHAFMAHACRINLRRMFPFLTMESRREGDALWVELRLPEDAEPCPSFFLMNVGCFEASTRLLGLGPSRVDYELTALGIRMDVRPPPSGTIWALCKRAFAALRNSEAHVETLTAQEMALDAQNRELRTALEERQRALASRDRFLQTVGHELRTPMNGLANGLEALHAELGREHEGLEVVRSSAHRLFRTLETALAFSKYASEDVVAQPRPTPLRPFLKEVVQASGEASRIFVDAPEGWLEFDLEHTRRALQELLANALQADPEGPIEVFARWGSGRLKVEIVDRGPGIPEDRLQHVLEPFTQLGDGEARSAQGRLGLGLSLASRAAEGLGGGIWLRNRTDGEGLSAGLEVPASKARARPAATVSENPMILVVDDDRINRIVTRRLLRSAGYHVVLAEDGQECLERMAEARFDLILMDCEMPVLNGWEATRRLRNSGCRIPIIAATAYTAESDRRRCREAGMDDFVAKPLNSTLIQNVLARWLGEGPAAAS